MRHKQKLFWGFEKFILFTHFKLKHSAFSPFLLLLCFFFVPDNTNPEISEPSVFFRWSQYFCLYCCCYCNFFFFNFSSRVNFSNRTVIIYFLEHTEIILCIERESILLYLLKAVPSHDTSHSCCILRTC